MRNLSEGRAEHRSSRGCKSFTWADCRQRRENFTAGLLISLCCSADTLRPLPAWNGPALSCSSGPWFRFVCRCLSPTRSSLEKAGQGLGAVSGSHLELLLLGAGFVPRCPGKGFWFAGRWGMAALERVPRLTTSQRVFIGSGTGSKLPPHPWLQVWLPQCWHIPGFKFRGVLWPRTAPEGLKAHPSVQSMPG